MRTKRDAGLPPTIEVRPQPRIITQEREYKVITPLFGGGAVTGEPDEITIVRGTEVRGQLRFWWRACYGGRYDTVKEMKKAEDRLWGAAAESKQDEKGKENAEEKKQTEMTVQIVVEPINEGSIREIQPYRIIPDKRGRNQAKSVRDIPDYAAFPSQPAREDLNGPVPPQVKPIFDNVHFRLTISFPVEKQEEITGTLWAWETFGGIGARTRRGFGALCVSKIDGKPYEDRPAANQMSTWIKDKFVHFNIQGKAPGQTPCLTSTMSLHVTRPSKDVKEAWNRLIQQLSEFRQLPYGRMNRSKWPEAEAIRALTGRRDAKYSRLPHPQKFPRAAFGLPIVFHFKDGDDPRDTTLQGIEEGRDRLASPLILRPLICKDNNAVGLAAILENVVLPEKLLLKEKNGREYQVSPFLEDQEAKKVEPLQGQTNALQAFMNYLRGNNS